MLEYCTTFQSIAVSASSGQAAQSLLRNNTLPKYINNTNETFGQSQAHVTPPFLSRRRAGFHSKPDAVCLVDGACCTRLPGYDKPSENGSIRSVCNAFRREHWSRCKRSVEYSQRPPPRSAVMVAYRTANGGPLRSDHRRKIQHHESCLLCSHGREWKLQ